MLPPFALVKLTCYRFNTPSNFIADDETRDQYVEDLDGFYSQRWTAD